MLSSFLNLAQCCRLEVYLHICKLLIFSMSSEKSFLLAVIRLSNSSVHCISDINVLKPCT